jgi:hypothetical protein
VFTLRATVYEHARFVYRDENVDLLVCLQVPRPIWQKAVSGNPQAQAEILRLIAPKFHDQTQLGFSKVAHLYHWHTLTWDSLKSAESLGPVIQFPVGRRAQPHGLRQPTRRARRSHTLASQRDLYLVESSDIVLYDEAYRSV